MPNWCYNELLVVGSEDSIDNFIKMNIDDNELSFNKTITLPKELSDGWYDWRVNNWGTKWDAIQTNIQRKNEEVLYIHFETAWDAPIEWLEKIQVMFPELNFCLFYYEFGVYFMGIAFSEFTQNTMQIISEEDKYGEEDWETDGVKLKIENLMIDINVFCPPVKPGDENYDESDDDGFYDRFQTKMEDTLFEVENKLLERLIVIK